MANDPLGQAIQDFAKNGKAEDIIVHSDLCEDDSIPTPYLFRSFKEMPKLEQVALNACKGTVLDVGMGAGTHALYLQERGLKVTGIDTSKGAVDYATSKGITSIQQDIHSYNDHSYDTLLVLMNGLGLAGTLEQLPAFLTHLKSLLNADGQIICDSTDVLYMYEDDEGGMWLDLNAEYYGNFKFQMEYKDIKGAWFDWLYVDLQKLTDAAASVGLITEVLHHDHENPHYLVKLSLAK